MLWFAVWTVLVVGTLLGAFFLGRDLWRKAGALLSELGRAADAFGRLADATEQAATPDGVPPIHAQLFDDRAALRLRVDELRAARRERAALRAERHVATFARWRAYSR
ncbi:hypothetical protein DDP54_14015 (plasmid) [Cellulomonas sp. WB94]|uniref:hypothetical protein n=1 Tax=Cellulomonas sp. WB94 TaxID=2173174 RepID=UPI000D5659BA|nr:hypothetical protein [Cellulomonas sp. WB94]PVU81723.1 hypothetical protein DDP54_14015 [Cellulomonas sp. WB94]